MCVCVCVCARARPRSMLYDKGKQQQITLLSVSATKNRISANGMVLNAAYANEMTMCSQYYTVHVHKTSELRLLQVVTDCHTTVT